MKTLHRKAALLATSGALLTTALLGVGAPAAASPVTPFLDCTTTSGGSFPSYHGQGTCTGSGRWLLRVSCSFGFTYDSPPTLNFNNTQTVRYGACNWGVNSVQVIPLAG
ncbi:hypothetical protein QLQ12_43180 [Actinoplanes sp. NEAU-A12]|uniref:Secreted protein n=1 Tax=Actinoplanes sandaracinus TaxID=3045177 RepID=A0ABT6X070_9ACTN|nr:hypothetical protein [Actinoplanes sandaracinus]MDI6105407.1 hypothetical protein [Actinoplanes sandaracinus]